LENPDLRNREFAKPKFVKPMFWKTVFRKAWIFQNRISQNPDFVKLRFGET
jgi:hypothetical protein